MNTDERQPLKPVALHDGIIYGPVRSRRLGTSLGLNILGAGGRVCPFNCVYCQLRDERKATLGRTGCAFDCIHCEDALTVRTDSSGSRPQLPSVETVLGAVELALLAHPQLDSITFSGNGEPTVHPSFPEIAEEVRRLRDRLAPCAVTSILSNSATLSKPSVVRGLAEFDLCVMKLDAGHDAGVQRVNRPCKAVRMKRIISGLKAMPPFALQTMLFAGPEGNASQEDLDSWMQTVSELKPTEVQLYTISRVPAEATCIPLPIGTLEEIAAAVRHKTGLKTLAYA